MSGDKEFGWIEGQAEKESRMLHRWQALGSQGNTLSQVRDIEERGPGVRTRQLREKRAHVQSRALASQ